MSYTKPAAPGAPLASVEGAEAKANRIRTDIATKARTALTSNAAFLAINNPTNAQSIIQVKALTRQMNAVIRVLGSVLPELVDLLADNTDT